MRLPHNYVLVEFNYQDSVDLIKCYFFSSAKDFM